MNAIRLADPLGRALLPGKGDPSVPRIPDRSIKQVPVGVQGELYRGVTETLGNLFCMDPFRDQQRGMRVAQVVKTDPRKLVLLEDDSESVTRIAGIERGAHARGEDVILLLPCRTGREL